MRRIVLVLVLAVLASAAVAAVDAAPIAEDPCGPGSFETAVPWQDLCSLALSSDTSDGVTELEVRLELVSTAAATPSMYTIRWDVGGCAVRLLLGDATPTQPAISAISRTCEGDEAGADCIFDDAAGVTLSCQDQRRHLPIDAPEVEGNAYVWNLRFEGELADFAGAHRAGTVLQVRTSTASTRLYETQDAASSPACIGGVCATLGDRMPGEVAFEVG